jgi:hypothetical protein
MPSLVPGIHVFPLRHKDMDGLDKPGHDKERAFPSTYPPNITEIC